MAKQLLYSDQARAAILKGVNQLADAVKATLGPKGRNAILDKKFGAPTITKDGVTVAKEVELKNPYENMGAQLVREVASKTSDTAGDGTTTAAARGAPRPAPCPHRHTNGKGKKNPPRRRNPDGNPARNQQGGRGGDR